MEQQPSNLFDLQIDPQSNTYLSEAARWGKFLSIVGFVFCGILVIIGFFAGSILGAAGAAMGNAGMGALAGVGGAFFTILYLLIALLYFFPCLYLYNFSVKMKAALAAQDQALLNTSFKNLKSWFRFFGIITIIILGLYALMLVFAGLGMAMM